MKHLHVVVVALVVVLFGLMAPVAEAHGGQYAGPGSVDIPPARRPDRNGPRIPKTGVPAFSQNGPTFDPARWECWWAMNREDFLVPGATATASDGGAMAAAVPMTREDVRRKLIPVLMRALKDKNFEVRASAAIALGKAGDGNDLDAIVRAVADHDRNVTEAAIVGLGLLREAKGEATLVNIFNTTERNVRERGMAAIALGFSGGEAARGLLLDGLGHGSAKASLASQAGFAPIESARWIGAGLWAGADRRDGTKDRGAMVASLLQRALGEATTLDRFDVAFGTVAIAKVRDPGSLPFVMKTLADPRADVRASAAIAAGRILAKDDAKNVSVLAQMAASDGDLFARRMATIALGRVGGPTAIKALKTRYENQEKQDRAFVALALGIAGATDVAPALRKEFESGSDDSLRGALAVSLGLLQDKASLPMMLDLVKQGRSPEVTAHTMWYFALLRDRTAAPVLIKLQNDSKSADLLCGSAFALGCIGDQAARDQLVKLISDGGSNVIKGSAATALGRLGDPAVLDALIKIVDDDHQQHLSRAYAVVALGNLGRRTPWSDLPRVAIDSNYDLRSEAVDEMKDIL